MIPFLISVDIFLVSDAIDKTRTNMHLVDYKLGVELTKLDPTHTLYPSMHLKQWNEHTQLHLCVHTKLNLKLWVPTHTYTLFTIRIYLEKTTYTLLTIPIH
jgi:hypothetical protein